MFFLSVLSRLLWGRPIILDQDFLILGGEKRFLACIELGYTEVPCIVYENITEEERREITIKDNAHFGQWDTEALANLYSDDPLEEWGLRLPGWNEEEEEEKPKEKGKKKLYQVLDIEDLPSGKVVAACFNPASEHYREKAYGEVKIFEPEEGRRVAYVEIWDGYISPVTHFIDIDEYDL